MPAARKMMADQGVDRGNVARHAAAADASPKGDVIGAVDGKAATGRLQLHRPTPAAPAAKPATAPPVALRASLGSRPEQRVPMSRLRQRVAERLVQSQSTAAILTTFNEVNMQPVIELRNRYKDRFEKEHGVEARASWASS